MNKTLLHGVLCFYACSMFAGYQAPTATSSSAQATNNSIFLSSQLTPNTTTSAIKNLVNAMNPYPVVNVLDNNVLQQGITSNVVASAVPQKVQTLSRKASLTMLHPSPNDFKTYPSGAQLFAKYPDIASKFDTMLTVFKTEPRFVTMFRKVHIGILNELYAHLMGVFMNFNLQHTGIAQDENTGITSVSIPLYLQSEEEFAANTKALIVTHMMDIIESQFNNAIRACTNNMPQTFATFVGRTAIQNDYSMDLTQLLVHQLEPVMVNFKKEYLTALGDYLSFFQIYTSYLNKPHPTYPNQFVAFVDIATQLNEFVYQDAQDSTNKTAVAFAKMNPPLFHFGFDDVCALQLIPYLAKSLPANVKSVPWPEHITQAAQQGVVVTVSGQKPNPLAYFRTPEGEVVRNLNNDPTVPLYVCLRLGDNIYEQQIIAQPEWLNSWQGVVKVLQACFGDFSQLVGMNILDPVMEALIINVLLTQKGTDPNATDNISAACKKTIALWTQATLGTAAVSTSTPSTQQTSTTSPALQQPAVTTPAIPSLPAIASLPTTPSLASSSVTPPLLMQP